MVCREESPTPIPPRVRSSKEPCIIPAGLVFLMTSALSYRRSRVSWGGQFETRQWAGDRLDGEAGAEELMDWVGVLAKGSTR